MIHEVRKGHYGEGSQRATVQENEGMKSYMTQV